MNLLSQKYLTKLRTIFNNSFNVVLLCLIFSNATGQQIKSAYINELESGETIFVITNRTEIKNSSCTKFENSVSKNDSLVYLQVAFYRPDSLSITCLDSINFFKKTSSYNTDWLLFVHGDSKTFEQSVMRGMDIQHLYDVRVIVFSWPTKDSELNGLKNIKNSKVNAIASKDHFSNLLGAMQHFRNNNSEFEEERNLSVFFHSLGNLLMKNYEYNPINKSKNSIIFDNIILNSAAVNQKNHKQWVEQLNIQKRIFITSNKSDFSLKGLRIFTKDGKQLGEKVEHPIAKNASYINFSKAVGFRTPTGTTHTFFIGEVPDQNKNIYNLYYNLFHGSEINFSDAQVFEERKDGRGYNIIKIN